MVMHAGDMAWALPELVWHLEDLRVGMSLPEPLHRAARLEVREGGARRARAATSCSPATRGATSSSRRPRRRLEPSTRRTTSTGRRLVPDARASRDSSRRRRLRRGEATARPFDVYRAAIEPAAELDPLAKALYFEAKTFLHGLLVVEDKVSMAHSLEARVPFLDNELVELARRIPARLKHGERRRQALLREAMRAAAAGRDRRRSASRASARPTSPGTAARRWTTSARCCSTRARSSAATSSRSTCSACCDEHLEGRVNHRLLIWSLLCFEWWNRLFIDGDAATALAERPEPRARRRARRSTRSSAALPAGAGKSGPGEGDAYVCPACGHRFPVVGGIPRLLEDVAGRLAQIQRVFDFEHRRFEDSWYTRSSLGSSTSSSTSAGCRASSLRASARSTPAAGRAAGPTRWPSSAPTSSPST